MAVGVGARLGIRLLVAVNYAPHLADLANSFDVVREMRLMPIGRQAVVQLAIMLALPLLPLTLTMIPLEEMIDRAVGVFF
jgi:hypothetical protein